METVAIIVGAGPAGLAISACLNRLNIPNVVLEKEDCYASLWKKKTYDRLKLHLAKQFCQLPYMPFPPHTPRFVPKSGFIKYLDEYASRFHINPLYNRYVHSAFFNEVARKWCVRVKNTALDTEEFYTGTFLVVATGENSEGFIPEIPGLDKFRGTSLHSNKYVNGKEFTGKNVLVIGCGNSGMEIAFDLYNWGANTSIVARSPVHVVTKEAVAIGMSLLKLNFPLRFVDSVTLRLCKLKFGNTSKYGLPRPKNGPFYDKKIKGRSPTIDVGTMKKIKAGKIKVRPSITTIEGNTIRFADGGCNLYDTIIFATGYRSTVNQWLKDGDDLFNESGMPCEQYPNHWKGKKGLYSIGFASMGLMGIANDAENIANDINLALRLKLALKLSSINLCT